MVSTPGKQRNYLQVASSIGSMKKHLRKRRFFGVIGGVIALAIAIAYLYIVPEQAAAKTGLQRVVLLYSHALCWVLLSGASIAWAVSKRRTVSMALIYAALAAYLAFIGALLGVF